MKMAKTDEVPLVNSKLQLIAISKSPPCHSERQSGYPLDHGTSSQRIEIPFFSLSIVIMIPFLKVCLFHSSNPYYLNLNRRRIKTCYRFGPAYIIFQEQNRTALNKEKGKPSQNCYVLS